MSGGTSGGISFKRERLQVTLRPCGGLSDRWHVQPLGQVLADGKHRTISTRLWSSRHMGMERESHRSSGVMLTAGQHTRRRGRSREPHCGMAPSARAMGLGSSHRLCEPATETLIDRRIRDSHILGESFRHQIRRSRSLFHLHSRIFGGCWLMFVAKATGVTGRGSIAPWKWRSIRERTVLLN